MSSSTTEITVPWRVKKIFAAFRAGSTRGPNAPCTPPPTRTGQRDPGRQHEGQVLRVDDGQQEAHSECPAGSQAIDGGDPRGRSAVRSVHAAPSPGPSGEREK